MSGAGAGNGIGSGGLPPELPQPDAAARPQQWNDAVRGAVDLLPDAVTTALVALGLNAPASLGAAFLRPGIIPEEMAAEGLDRRPVGLTDPTPSIDRMAPVDAAIAGQDAGLADLRSPLAPSAALPQQLAAMLQAAGYGGDVPARVSNPAVMPLLLGSSAGNVTPTATVGTVVSDPAPASASPSASVAVGTSEPAIVAPSAGAVIAGPVPTIASPSASVVVGGSAPTIGRTTADATRAPTAALDLAAPGLGWQPVVGLASPVPFARPGTPPPTAGRATAAVQRIELTDPARTFAGVVPVGREPSETAQTFVRQAISGDGGRDIAAPALHRPVIAGSPILTTSLHDAGGAERDRGQLVSYAEQRPVPIDLAPVSAEVPAWRLDDTQTLVTIGPAGAMSATRQAAGLYRNLMDGGAGLAAIRPGEGFITWEGSPLWLSLAAIRKPAELGVLAASDPGRVQVMRTEHGEWLVEHAGGSWRARRALRHDATAADDESLLLDVLYGVAAGASLATALRRFETARAAVRFAGSVAGPAGCRAQEAWAMVARCCAMAAAQPSGDALPSADEASARAMQAALSAVVDGLAPAVAAAPFAIAPLARDRFITAALSGDSDRLAAGLRGLGRTVLDRVRRGLIDEIDPVETLALAVCLGRLTRETATVRVPRVSGGPARIRARPALAGGWHGVQWRRQ